MARNGSGVYSLPVGYEATSGATATAAQHNDPLEDLQNDANTARPVVAGGTGATNAADARTNLGVTTVISNISDGTTAITPNLGVGTKYDGTALTGRPLTNGESNTLGKGFNTTDYNAGTKSSGTFTPDPANGNQQYYINGGAHTLAPPATSCTMVVHITNNASAGGITTTGFTRVYGTFTATDGDEFLCQVLRCNSKSVMSILRLQ